MVGLWPLGAVVALLAAAGSQAQPEPQMKTKVLPGNGYIRYQVLPGDDEKPPGELIVTHDDTQPAPARPQQDVPPPPEEQQQPPAAAADPCEPLRAKLLERMLEMRGLTVEPDFAAWLERNLNLGTRSLFAVGVAQGEPLVLLSIKTDEVARGIAEDLARCEAR